MAYSSFSLVPCVSHSGYNIGLRLADRRRIHLLLTAEAAPITAEIEKVRASFHKKIFRGFTEEEQRLFTEFNERIAENTKRTEGEITV